MLLVSTLDSMNSFWPRRVKKDSIVAYSVTFRSTAVKLARLKSAADGGGAAASSRRPVTAKTRGCQLRKGC
jgi:hypothetical protein